jgi:hypothetical protein
MVQIVYSPEAFSIPYQLIVLIISSIVFALISVYLVKTFGRQKEELIYRITKSARERENDMLEQIDRLKRVNDELDARRHEAEVSGAKPVVEKEIKNMKKEISKLKSSVSIKEKELRNIWWLKDENLRRLKISELEKLEKDLSLLGFYYKKDTEPLTKPNHET